MQLYQLELNSHNRSEGGEGDRGVTNVYVTIATTTIQRLFTVRMENKASIYLSLYLSVVAMESHYFHLLEQASHHGLETFQTASVSSSGVGRKG